MNRVSLLCALDRYMLSEFCQRSAQSLNQRKLFRLMLGPLRRFLESNVQKEIEKDRQVILRAASLVQADRFPTGQDVQYLLKLARDIDRGFLEQTSHLPVDIAIPYQDIEPIRQQRMQIILNESHQLLRDWRLHHGLRRTFAAVYTAPQFAKLMFDVLHLYSLETKELSQSVRLPGIIAFARDSMTQTVYMVMESVARQLAQELTIRIYGSTQAMPAYASTSPST
ncbi:MAG: hypothetical protein GC149_12020 [Gammaproteobacteria bacterium]|nr:hypothetical protein [Gammaproteobacteria bacterium]